MSNLWKSFHLLLLFAFLLTSCATVTAIPNTANSYKKSAVETPLPIITLIETVVPGSATKESQQVKDTSTPALEKTKQIPQNKSTETGSISKEESSMPTITITVGSSSFSAKLYDNETTRALLAKLPLNLNMSELNGREKYYHFAEDLPSPLTEKPETIHAGEIMLWSSSSLVLFYNTFSNSYSGYVKLGYVEDITGLADALGSGNVQVTFTTSK